MKALLIIFIVISALLLIPLGVDGGFRDNTIILSVKIGPFSIKLLPAKRGGLISRLTAKKPKKKKDEPVEDETEEKEPKEKKSFGEILDLVKIGLKALGRFKKQLSIDYLRIWCSVAASDPFDTAMRYGIISAAVSAYYPLIDGAFNVKERDYSIESDFLTAKTRVEVWLTATLNILDLLYIAIAFGIDYLKLNRKNKNDDSKNNETEIERNEANG